MNKDRCNVKNTTQTVSENDKQVRGTCSNYFKMLPMFIIVMLDMKDHNGIWS